MPHERAVFVTKKAARFCTIACLGGAIICNANAGDIRDQMEVVTGKAELVIPNVTAQVATGKIKDAVSQWAIPANANIRSLPSTIPARPDEPTSTQQYFFGAPVVAYQCRTAYAEITKAPPPVNNAFARIAELLQVCVYPFQNGTKVYLLHTRIKRFESLTSGLFGGITKAIQGTDDEWISKQINENITAIRKNLPTLLVEKIEIPGAAIQEPDKSAVAALIPAASEVQTSPSPAQKEYATPITTASAPTALQSKIEARKSLTAMGLQYHSSEQFIAAIKRKDDVAVQLYLDAGAIDLTQKIAGKSYDAIAEESGAPDIARMILSKVTASKSTEIPATTMVPASRTSPAMLSQEERTAMVAKLEAMLSDSEKAEIEEIMNQIPQGMTAEEKASARLNILTLRVQVKQLNDRIDPETGSLRF